MSDFDLGRPVIFGGYTDQHSFLGIKGGAGSGHSWVSDGYINTYDTTNNYAPMVTFHMNWGWDGTQDKYFNGWFSINNWAIYSSNGVVIKNFQYCQEVIINIYP